MYVKLPYSACDKRDQIKYNSTDASYETRIFCIHVISRNETRSCNPRLQKNQSARKTGTCRARFRCGTKEIERER